MEALSFALEGMETIEEAKDLLDDFAQSADITGLAVYDAFQTPLYVSAGFGSAPPDLDADDYYDLATLDVLKALARQPRTMGQYYFNASNYEEVPDGADADGSGDDADSAGSAGSEAKLFCGMAKNGKWTLAIRTSDSESRMKALECFDWREMLQNIKTGDESMILAIDQNSGSILSAPDSTLFGQPAEALKPRLEDAEGPASLDDLKAAFGKKDDIVRVESGGRDCYAIRLNVDDVLMLMIAPVEGHGDILENVVIMRALFLMLITGICALYACFQIKGAKGNSVRRFKRFAWDRRLSGRLTACAALVCTVALLFGLFMEAVFTRAEAYDYNRDKSIGAAMLYFDNQDSAGRLQRWFDEEYLTRCQIARAILKHIPAEKKNRAYIAALAEKLSVKYIYVFDGDGAIVAANSPYDRITVGRGDPFYKLLEGCPQMTGEITFPGAPGETLRRVGITMHDESQDGEGLIMIVKDESWWSATMNSRTMCCATATSRTGPWSTSPSTSRSRWSAWRAF